jgi:glycosyltransferase involved in cell wall biosynthesis
LKEFRATDPQMTDIAFINNTSETFTPTHSGAISTWIWENCRAAHRAGKRPHVITQPCEHAPYDLPETVFVNYPRLPKTKVGVLMHRVERKLDGWRHLRQRTFAQRIVQTLRDRELQHHTLVLHNDPELATYLARRFPRTRIVHHFHNQQPCKPHYRSQLGKNRVTVTAVSDFTARWNETYYGLPAGSIRTIHNGVDSSRFVPSVPGGRVERILVNFCGRTCVEKAPDLLLKAANTLGDRHDKFAVQIIGANHWGRFELDDYQRELQSLAEQAERQGVMIYRPGFLSRDAMPAALAKAHVHVVPSRWDEPCALTILEGMAAGMAIVASRTGGTPELVGDAGLLFERDRVDELAGHLRQLIDNDSLRTDLARRARERAMTFTWDRTWSQFDALAGGTN